MEKKRERFNVSIGLAGVLIASIAISIMYSLCNDTNAPVSYDHKAHKKLCLPSLLDKNLSTVLQSYMHARGIDIIGGNTQQCLLQDIYDLALIIMHDKKCPLTQREKQDILLSFACNYTNNKTVQYKLFDLMLVSGVLQMHSLKLLDLMHSSYSTVLPGILSWVRLEKTQTNMKNIGLQGDIFVEEALTSTVLTNNFHDLEALNSWGVRVTPEQSSKLLMHVVYERKDPSFIPFLIKRGADIHYVGPDKHTVLTKAITNQDVTVVQALFESGADIRACDQEEKNMISRYFGRKGNRQIKALLDVYGQNI